MLAVQVRLKLETPLFVMDALLEAAKQLLANELATAEEEAEAVSMVRLVHAIRRGMTASVNVQRAQEHRTRDMYVPFDSCMHVE